MTTAFLFGFLALLCLLLLLYAVDLIVFLCREKKHFDAYAHTSEYVRLLEEKQQKAKHPQKKNSYLYLLCICFAAHGQTEKAERLLPFLRDDHLLGVYKKDF